MSKETEIKGKKGRVGGQLFQKSLPKPWQYGQRRPTLLSVDHSQLQCPLLLTLGCLFSLRYHYSGRYCPLGVRRLSPLYPWRSILQARMLHIVWMQGELPNWSKHVSTHHDVLHYSSNLCWLDICLYEWKHCPRRSFLLSFFGKRFWVRFRCATSNGRYGFIINEKYCRFSASSSGPQVLHPEAYSTWAKKSSSNSEIYGLKDTVIVIHFSLDTLHEIIVNICCPENSLHVLEVAQMLFDPLSHRSST